MAFQICPDSNLSACCPLSHLLRKCQLSQGESREAGANFLPYVQTKLVSPSGRDVAQRQRGLAPSLRELDCRHAARLREQPVIWHAQSLREFTRLTKKEPFAFFAKGSFCLSGLVLEIQLVGKALLEDCIDAFENFFVIDNDIVFHLVIVRLYGKNDNLAVLLVYRQQYDVFRIFIRN